MRQVVRLLGNRYAVGLGVLVVVALVVVVARGLGGPVEQTPLGTTAVTTPPTSHGTEQPDDSVVSVPGSGSPSPSANGVEPQVVAMAFARAWLAHQNVTAAQWHFRLARYATDDLSQKLRGVDPAQVPADRLTGDPEVVDRADSYAQVRIPVDSGVLDLRVVLVDGRWLVDGVDWDRG
ncbi:MAG TPA: hypothetical protein VF054_19770 [Micromonosporaceae bacterium]